MKKIKCYFLCVLGVLLFTSIEALALKPISAEEACSHSYSSDADRCIAIIRGRNIDPYGAAGCTEAYSADIPLCLRSIIGDRFYPAAVVACGDAYSSDVTSCLSAIANKKFSSSIISTCRNRYSSEIASCFSYAAYQRYIGMPERVQALDICDKLSSSDKYNACIEIVRDVGVNAFHPLALGVCNLWPASAESKLDCMQKIAPLEFNSDREIINCVDRSPSYSRAVGCLTLIGKRKVREPRDDDDWGRPGRGHSNCFPAERLHRVLYRLEEANRAIDHHSIGTAKNILGGLIFRLNRYLDTRRSGGRTIPHVLN